MSGTSLDTRMQGKSDVCIMPDTSGTCGGMNHVVISYMYELRQHLISWKSFVLLQDPLLA